MDYLPTSLKGYVKSARDTVMQLPELERKVNAATSNEKWGPTATQMKELSEATYNTYSDLPVVMSSLLKRLNDSGKNWRHVYKALLVIEYLLRNGHEQVIRDLRDNMMQIKTLNEFQYYDEEVRQDFGLNVRERSKTIMDLLHDNEKLEAERRKAKQNYNKYVGMGSDVGQSQHFSSDDLDDRERDRERERERERDRERDRSSSQSSFDPRKSDSRASNSTPSTPKPTPSTPQQPQRSLLDFDEPAPAPKPATQDLFSLSVPQQSQPQQNNNSNFSFDSFSGPTTTSNNSGFGSPNNGFPSSSPNNGFTSFPPASSSNSFPPASPAPVQQQQSNSNFEFGSFEGAGAGAAPEKKEDNKDPWKMTHLFDMSNKSNTQTQSTPSKVPMGSVGTSKPMGMGQTMGQSMGQQQQQSQQQGFGQFGGAQQQQQQQQFGQFGGQQQQQRPQQSGGFSLAPPPGAKPANNTSSNTSFF